jgi:hypothetical protein
MARRVRLGFVTMAACVALGLGSAAKAEVRAGTGGSFTIHHEALTKEPPSEAYQRFQNIASWWDGAHSYSGDAKNLSIDVSPGGCWCENLPDGGFVEHMRAVLAIPNKTLRFSGGLGPLQSVAASAALTVSFAPVEGGTKVMFHYVVVGSDGEKVGELGDPVDQVIGAALRRFAKS